MPVSPSPPRAGCPPPPPPLPSRASSGLCCCRLLQPLRLSPEFRSHCESETPTAPVPGNAAQSRFEALKWLLPGKGEFGFSVGVWCCNLSFQGCCRGGNISNRALHQQISLPHPGPWAGITLRAPTLHPSSMQALAAGFKTP